MCLHASRLVDGIPIAFHLMRMRLVKMIVGNVRRALKFSTLKVTVLFFVRET